MTSLWTTLAPLVIGSALVPIQIVITILLLRSDAGRITAFAWVGGMTAVRLAQGVLFGLVFSGGSSTTADSSGGPGPVVSGLLLVLAVLFYVMAVRQVTAKDDPDAPPPRWMTMTETMGPTKAFLIGAGLLGIGVKFWVFTLGAVGAIADAGLGSAASIGLFLLFVVLAESAQLVVLGAAVAIPDRSAAALDVASAWLADNNGRIVIVLGVVFGTYFLLKALSGLGVI